MLDLLNQKWGPSNLYSSFILHMRKLWSERWSNLALVSVWPLTSFWNFSHHVTSFPLLEFPDYMLFLTTSALASCPLSYFFLSLCCWNPIFICSCFPEALGSCNLKKSVHLSLLMVLCFYFYFCISVWLYFIDTHSYQSFVSLYICSLRARMMFYLSL